MVKNRNVYFDGFKGQPLKLVTIKEEELFKNYISLLEKDTAIATIKHGQKPATQAQKDAIASLYINSFDFQFDKAAEQKVWCKISRFVIKRNLETEALDIDKKVYKTLEAIAPTDDWQHEWATCWLVFDDDAKLTKNKTKQALIKKYTLESINLKILEDQPPRCFRVDLEQQINQEILRKYILRSPDEAAKIKLEIREIQQSEPIAIPEQAIAEEAYFYGGDYLGTGERKVLSVSSFFERR